MQFVYDLQERIMLIGIDPGKKTGLAAWLPEEDRFQEIRTCTIIQAMRFCQLAIRDGIEFEIWFEDARQRKWFGRAGRERLQEPGSAPPANVKQWRQITGASPLSPAPSSTGNARTIATMTQVAGYTLSGQPIYANHTGGGND